MVFWRKNGVATLASRNFIDWNTASASYEVIASRRSWKRLPMRDSQIPAFDVWDNGFIFGSDASKMCI